MTETTDFGAGGPKNMTLYAQWNINTYTLTFDSTGGSAVAPVTTNYNQSVIEPAPPSSAGRTFVGWFTTPTGDTAWDFANPVTTDLTVYAHWKAVPALAATGANLTGWPLLGAILLFAGGALLLTRRFRRLTR